MKLVLFIFSIMLVVMVLTLGMAVLLSIIGSKTWANIFKGSGRDE